VRAAGREQLGRAGDHERVLANLLADVRREQGLERSERDAQRQ
jgi:hypothetical protein